MKKLLLIAGIMSMIFSRVAIYPNAAMTVYGLTGFFLSMIYGPMTKIVSENTDLLLALNEFYAKSDSLQQAFDCLVEYERIEGRSIQTGYRKILYKLGLGDTIAVMAEIDSLIANDRNSAAPWMIKGDVLNYLNMQDSVLPSFLKAERPSP